MLNFKGPIININNCLNGIFPFFNSLNYEFSPRTQLIDIFSSHFSFYHANHKDKDSGVVHLCKLDKYIFYVSNDSKLVVVVLDVSNKNNITTSILHVHLPSNLIKKTIHHAVNVMFTKAELFAIRWGIDQAI